MFVMSICGKLLIAAFFWSSSALTYFWVNLRLLCPNSSLTTLILAPLLNRLVAKECRPQCHVICLSMPARFVQCLRALLLASIDGKLKIKSLSLAPSGFSPMIASNVSFKGIGTPLTLLSCCTLLCLNVIRRFA